MIPSETNNPLPARAQAPPRAEPAGTLAANGRQRGVLVVDDEECVRGVLETMLRQQGLAVWLAADGWEALDLYRLHRAAIDLVLLDVRMPGLDGPATLTSLRRQNPQVCCCFLSGNLGEYTEGELRDLGAAAVFHKPFRLADLTQAVRRLAGRVGETAPSVPLPRVLSLGKGAGSAVPRVG